MQDILHLDLDLNTILQTEISMYSCSLFLFYSASIVSYQISQHPVLNGP